MKIGCVREVKKQEYRVGITPDNTKEYVSLGHEVLIEKEAGLGSGFSDEEYAEAGARVLETAQEVWESSEMIIKVKEPQEEEYGFLREDLILYAYLHLAADRKLTEVLMERKVKSVAYETLTEKDGSLPLLKPMSEIAGRLSVQEGAKYLEKTFGGSGVLLSGVPGTKKAKIVILGAGNVGMNACKIAVGIGADVTILDTDLNKLTQLDHMYGERIQTLASSDSIIESEVKDADLVIGSVLIPGKQAPKLFKKKYLSTMRPGSVIVDVAVDQGGCFETTRATYHEDPVYTVDGIIHYCVGNMPGAVPRTSTIALTNYTLRYGLQIAEHGLEGACEKNPVIYSAVNTYGGECTCTNVAVGFDMKCAEVQSVMQRQAAG